MEWIPCYSSVFYILTIKEAHALCLIADGEKAYSLDQSAKKAPVSSFFAILFRSLVSLILLIVPPPISSTVDAFLPSSSRPLVFLLEQNSQLWAFFHASDGHSVTTHTHTREHMRLHSLSVTMTLSAPHSQLDLLWKLNRLSLELNIYPLSLQLSAS